MALEGTLAEPAKFWNRFAGHSASLPVPDEVTYQIKLEVSRNDFRADPDKAVYMVAL